MATTVARDRAFARCAASSARTPSSGLDRDTVLTFPHGACGWRNAPKILYV